VAVIGLLVLVSCTEDPPTIAETDDVDTFAKSVLNNLQPQSIAQSVEYCGYIFETAAGELAATPARRGGEDFCDLDEPDASVTASYHTHGGFSENYDNEVPSTDDVAGDFEAGIDGYISTPGGRVWHVDYEDQIARQLCNTLCVTSDPNNEPEDAGFVPQTFTLEELEARFE
jgi:hypothetical protein